MFRKAPRLLALLATAVWLLARPASAGPIGGIDTPTDGQHVSGIVRVSGFVLDFKSVDKIELFVDGVLVNRAAMNLPRVDVLEIFPDYYASATPNPGFITSFLARGAYSDGPHSVSIQVTESASQETTTVATVTVIVDSTANQAPFGWIDIPSAAGLENLNGAYPVVGWAIDDVDIDHIDFLVDGQVVAGAVGRGKPSTAIYGTTRPDIAAAFQDVPFALYSGFAANIDATKLVNGVHVLLVRATDDEGASRVIGERTVLVNNNGANLGPFGQIDFPLDKASLFCSITPGGIPSPCSPQECNEILSNVVAGWALDVGSRLDQGQVAYVELMLDGVVIANSQSDCVQVGQALTNCKGLNRPDVERNYSGYVNSDNAGFNFSFALIHDDADTNGVIEIRLPSAGEVGGLRAFDGHTTVAGKHTLAIRAGDEEETVTQFGAMSVDILCDTTEGDQPAIGYIDTPSDYQFINGFFEVFGWAFDFQGVAIPNGVEVDVDGQVVGVANFPLSRPDVPANDPRVFTSNVGFAYILDTTKLSNSEHDLVIYVIDKTFGGGHRTEIGRRKFVVDNNVATHQ